MPIPLIGFEVFNIVGLTQEDPVNIYNYLNIGRQAQIVAEVFWGLWLFPLGRLVIESKYFPKFLGYLLIASCFGYLIAVTIKVAIPQASSLLVVTDVLAFGELIFALWFVIKGLKIDTTIS